MTLLNNIITVGLLIILILFVGFFTSSETAYLSLPKIKLRSMLDEKRRYSKTVAKLKSNMDRLLTTVLIGTNFLNSLASAVATAFAIRLLGPKGSSIAPFVTAFFITTFGQIIPKTAAALFPENFCCNSSLVLLFLQKMFFPVIWLFERLSHCIVFIVEKIIKTENGVVTQEELKTLIDVGEKEGTIEKDESRMLNKIIKFNDLSVTDIMKHRYFVSMVSENASYNEIISEFEKSGFSTLTVYKDNKQNVTGVINYKTILFSDEKIDNPDACDYAKKIMSDVLYVPGTLTVLEMLRKFRVNHYKFAVVLNEQGVALGITTMEDIIRAVFGRMTDENSYDDLPAENKIKLVSYNTFRVPGDIKLEDVNEILNLKLESENVNTIGGWVLEKVGHLPSVGDVLNYGKSIFITEDVMQRRIVTLKIMI